MILSEPGVFVPVSRLPGLATALEGLPSGALASLAPEDAQVIGELLRLGRMVRGREVAAVGNAAGLEPGRGRDSSEVLNVAGVAERHAVSPRTVRYHARRGWLPGWQIGEGERWLFAVDEVALWAAERGVTGECASTADRGRADRPGGAAGVQRGPRRGGRVRGTGTLAS